jgi:hypothetical protein
MNLKKIFRTGDLNQQPFDYETDDSTARPSGRLMCEAFRTILKVTRKMLGP